MGRPLITCKATSKQTGRRCGRAPVPFTVEAGMPLCKFHGGWSPSVLAQADAAFEKYVKSGPEMYEPHYVRQAKIKAKFLSDKRREVHFAKKQAKIHGLVSQVQVLPMVPFEDSADTDDWF